MGELVKIKRIFTLIFLSAVLGISFPGHSKNFITSFFRSTGQQIRKLIWGHNFHTVDASILYRCRQLSDTEMENYITKYDIKTVLNLRPEDEEPDAFQQEKQMCKKNNILFLNVPMNGQTITPEYDVKQLITILEIAPRPIIVHCRAGADRTGEVCALYKLLNDSSTDEALSQLSLKYSHFSWLLPRKQELIKNIDTLYPKIIPSMKKACSLYNFAPQEASEFDPKEILRAIQ